MAELVDDVANLQRKAITGEEQLAVMYLVQRVGVVVVLLQEVEHGQAEQLEDETHVAPVVEPPGHLSAQAETAQSVKLAQSDECRQ